MQSDGVVGGLAKGSGVEKVERVLAVEEEARSVVTDARERSAAIRTAADSEAGVVLSEGAAQANADAAAERERALRKAQSAADSLTLDAAAQREIALASGRERLQAVSRRLADSLKG